MFRRVLLLSLAFVPLSAASGQDLVPAARRALRGFMTLNPERLPSTEGYYRYHFGGIGLPVPQLQHSQWDLGDCTGRAIQAWIFAREMTGDRTTGRTVERGQRAYLLSLLDPDTGLVTVPERADRQTGAPYVQMWDQGRTLRALVRWWSAETDPSQRRRVRAAIDRMVAGLDRLAYHGTDADWGEYAVYKGDCFVGGKPGDDMGLMRGGQVLEPLAMYWRASGDTRAFRLAEQICAGVLSGREADGYTGWLADTLRFGPDGSFTGHFHDHASIVLGVAKHGAALVAAGQRERGLMLLRWAKRSYDWTLSPTNVNAGSRFGWFPENTDEGKAAREVSEVCCLADMIELAAALAGAAPLDPSLAGHDALWDHVERYAVNTLLRSQFTITPEYERLLGANLGGTTLHNPFLSFELNAHGAYSHEAVGHQTLGPVGEGHLSQTLYAVRHAEGEAGFTFAGAQMPLRNLQVVEATRREGEALVGVVATTDGVLRIQHRTALGRGPYVLREFVLRNTGARELKGVRFTVVANLDFAEWSRDHGRADAERGLVVVAPHRGPGCAAVAGVPRPDAVRVGDAGTLLSAPSSAEWPSGPAEMQGNPAGLLGWQLGNLSPGQEKAVRVILAVARGEADLRRALSGQTFPGWKQRTDPAAAYLKIARRQEGCFVACAYPNDLVFRRGDGSLTLNWMGCCHYAGVTGLYGAWKAIFGEQPGRLSVRLPLPRAGKMASQSVREVKGRVVREIALHSGCAVRVRIPDWADMTRVRVVVHVRGTKQRLAPRVTGRWLALGSFPAGARLTIAYPLARWTTHERVGGSNRGDGFCPPDQKLQYTVTWVGNRVRKIDPPGQHLPLFREARQEAARPG